MVAGLDLAIFRVKEGFLACFKKLLIVIAIKG